MKYNYYYNVGEHKNHYYTHHFVKHLQHRIGIA